MTRALFFFVNILLYETLWLTSLSRVLRPNLGLKSRGLVFLSSAWKALFRAQRWWSKVTLPTFKSNKSRVPLVGIHSLPSPPPEGSIVSNEQETQWHSARRHRILYTLLDHRVLFKSLFVHEWIDLPVVAPPLHFYCRQNYFPSPPTHGLQSTVCFKLNGCIFITACTVQIIPSKDFWWL